MIRDEAGGRERGGRGEEEGGHGGAAVALEGIEQGDEEDNINKI